MDWKTSVNETNPTNDYFLNFYQTFNLYAIFCAVSASSVAKKQ